MNSDTVREFDEKGYVLVRDVLDAQTVQRLRRLLLEEFKKQSTNVLNDGIIHYPEFSEILKQPKLVSALVELLGKPFIVPPHSSAMHESFGVFHTDTTGPELKGHSFHKQKEYRMVTVAIYLQDNNEYGGGIWLVPGTHRKPDKYVTLTLEKKAYRDKVAQSPMRKILKRLSRDRLFNWNASLEDEPDQVNVPTKAGDAVIWDMRLAHRAAPAKTAGSQFEGGKIGIFFTAGANNAITTKVYMDFVNSLPANAHLQKTRATPGITLPPATENFVVM
jgi:ectoine hydroxylase-related dioxygenase (phytanoyl-CoA dioxygenase family)